MNFEIKSENEPACLPAKSSKQMIARGGVLTAIAFCVSFGLLTVAAAQFVSLANTLGTGKTKSRDSQDANTTSAFQRIASTNESMISSNRAQNEALLEKAESDRNAGRYKEAFEQIKQLAESGMAEGMAQYGFYLWHGVGCEKDMGGSIRWFNLAAEKGHINAMYQLGYAFWNGEGVTKDESQGNYWMKKSAEGNCGLAQTEMGRRCYNAGQKAEARAWLTLGESNGVLHAQYNLALLYEGGEGGPKDLTKARALYFTATMRGHEMAAANLAAMYMEGLGGAIDLSEAAKWCLVANQLNPELRSPKINLANLRPRFSDSQWNTVSERAKETHRLILERMK